MNDLQKIYCEITGFSEDSPWVVNEDSDLMYLLKNSYLGALCESISSKWGISDLESKLIISALMIDDDWANAGVKCRPGYFKLGQQET